MADEVEVRVTREALEEWLTHADLEDAGVSEGARLFGRVLGEVMWEAAQAAAQHQDGPRPRVIIEVVR